MSTDEDQVRRQMSEDGKEEEEEEEEEDQRKTSKMIAYLKIKNENCKSENAMLCQMVYLNLYYL